MRAIRLTRKKGRPVMLYVKDEPVTCGEKTTGSQAHDFMQWWSEECAKHNISCPYDVYGVRLAKKLLEEYGMERLQRMVKHFLMAYGPELRKPDETRRLIYFGQKRKEIETEIKEMGLWL